MGIVDTIREKLKPKPPTSDLRDQLREQAKREAELEYSKKLGQEQARAQYEQKKRQVRRQYAPSSQRGISASAGADLLMGGGTSGSRGSRDTGRPSMDSLFAPARAPPRRKHSKKSKKRKKKRISKSDRSDSPMSIESLLG